MHVTPDEVAGIASLAPGMMTINPETGLPEAGAFRDMLGFAAPFLISMIPGIGPVLGPAIGGAVGAKIRGGDTRDMLLGAATGALGGKMFGGMAEAGTQATGLESLMSGTDISSLQNIIPEEQFAQLGSLMGEGMNVGDALASMDLPVGQMGNITSSLGKIPYQPGAFIDSGVGSPMSVTIPEVAPWNKPFEQMSFGEKMAGIKGGGLGGLKSGLMTLPGLGTIAGTGLGTQRDMTRRFEEQILKNKEEAERRKAEMYAMYPENIPYRGGGSIYKNRYINGNWS